MEKHKISRPWWFSAPKKTVSVVVHKLSRRGFIICLPTRLKKLIFLGNAARNRAAIEAEKISDRETDSANTKRLTETRLTHHNFQSFDVPCLKKIIANVRQKLSRQEEAQMLDVEVNGRIWGHFMSATMKAAVHLGPDYERKLCSTKNTDFEQRQ